MTVTFRTVRWALCLICVLGLTGCATFMPRYVVRDYCVLHKPFQASRKDTPGTQRAIDLDRAKYRKRCDQ